MMEGLQRLLAPLHRRIMLMIGRAIIESVKDSGDVQVLQLGLPGDELRDQVDRYQNYGFTSVPLDGAEAVAVFPGGSRDHGIVIAVEDRRYRLKGLQDGEVAIYTDEGDKIHLKRGNKVEIETSDFKVTTDKFTVLGGEFVVDADSVAIATDAFSVETQTASIGNAAGEVISILSDFMAHVQAGKTSTAMGPMPLVGAEFPSDKTKLDTFKE